MRKKNLPLKANARMNLQSPQYPCILKEEEVGDDELERMLEERYKTRANFVTYADNGYEHKRSIVLRSLRSLILEMGALSRSTSDRSFENAALRALRKLWNLRSSLNLLGTTLDVETGEWIEHSFGIGVGIVCC
ncbi:unnamed protein product [Fraxinus pennsylvanica]|uniref:Uncharacterized protein n=1 Tax=Fraxinus pennsylvanica TaxID=56036 RepID=A0AAD1Z0V8_9LAMI|nr:unnamed protein product [Fraxinus pennsylvanica]